MAWNQGWAPMCYKTRPPRRIPQPMTMMPSLGKTQVPRGCANFERFLLREIQVLACTGSEGERGEGN